MSQKFLPSSILFLTLAAIVLARRRSESNGVCPGSSLLYHEGTAKCYKYGTKGPCPNNLKLRHSPTEAYKGICACAPTSVVVDNNYVSVPSILHRGKNRCYKIYTQAYCAKNKWLVYTKNRRGKGREARFECVENPCVGKTYLDYPVWVNNRCAELGYRCSTSNTEQHIGFHIKGLIPSCDLSKDRPDFLHIGRDIRCDEGQVQDENGYCEYVVDF